MRSRRSFSVGFLGALGVLGGLTLPGCLIGGDGKSYLNENDELRRENLQLERQIEMSRERIDLLAGELEHLRDENRGDHPIEGAVRPVLSGLRFARYSGPVDDDGDGTPDMLRLYLRPVDQMGRMHVTAGEMRLQAVQIQPATPPKVIAERTVTPDELDKAYRTGFTGDTYALTMPLPADAIQGVDELTVRADLTEAGTGQNVSAQQVFGLDR